MTGTILDGVALARAREPGLARRAERVADRRGSPPRVLVVAFADATGGVPWVGGKFEACRRVGVDVRLDALPAQAGTDAVRRAVADPRADGVFVQIPFPAAVEPVRALDAIPLDADVDVMSAAAAERYRRDPTAHPPLTASATLALFDAHGVDIADREGVVVGPSDAYHEMFRTALARRGATMAPLVDPAASDPTRALGGADLVVLSAGRPGLISAGRLRPGAVVVDAGYFNAGGRGDLDTTAGVAHLGALAPVPGGVGPMTVSMLIERVIEAAERAAPESARR